MTPILNAVEREVPAGKTVHAILDNYAAHKHPEVPKWLARHPRWTFHFTPTSASWLNAVEGFFATPGPKRRLKRSIFQCRGRHKAAINRFLDDRTTPSQSPSNRSLVPEKYIQAVRRGHQASIQSTRQSVRDQQRENKCGKTEHARVCGFAELVVVRAVRRPAAKPQSIGQERDQAADETEQKGRNPKDLRIRKRVGNTIDNIRLKTKHAALASVLWIFPRGLAII